MEETINWNSVDSKFKEIMNRDSLKVGSRISIYHQDKGLVEGKITMKRNDGVLEILDDYGTSHSANVKYCRILSQEEVNILTKPDKKEMKKQQFLTEENKVQLDDLFRDGKSSVQDKCENEKAKRYAGKSMFTLAAANEIGVHPSLVDTYLKEKEYIGGKTIKTEKLKYIKHKESNKSRTFFPPANLPEKMFATCSKIEKQNLGNETVLLTLTLNSGDNMTIGNILISETLLSELN